MAQGAGATGLQAMLPASGPTGALQAIARNGQPVAFATQTIKGITYATFPADAGSYVATYPAPAAAVPAPVTGASKKAAARIRTVEVLSRAHRGADLPAPEAQHAQAASGRRALAGHHLPPEAHVARGPDLPHDQGQDRPAHPNAAAATRPGTVLRLRWDGRDSKGRYVKPARYSFTVTATGSHYQKTARGSVRVLAATT